MEVMVLITSKLSHNVFISVIFQTYSTLAILLDVAICKLDSTQRTQNLGNSDLVLKINMS